MLLYSISEPWNRLRGYVSDISSAHYSMKFTDD